LKLINLYASGGRQLRS